MYIREISEKNFNFIGSKVLILPQLLMEVIVIHGWQKISDCPAETLTTLEFWHSDSPCSPTKWFLRTLYFTHLSNIIRELLLSAFS